MPAADPADLSAPIAGTLQAWEVADGDTVEKGDLIAVKEAMKMVAQVTATRSGIFRLFAGTGSYLEAGAPLGRYEE
ncbi:MAG TPA: acetyl-CoA carboxylase biotin carboxyl carrier protein subunit [Rhizobium sp.]|nr:acetyl-CoA carboxylase biotin carboxyl carrier protein subunit [Rhizobium sp.]